MPCCGGIHLCTTQGKACHDGLQSTFRILLLEACHRAHSMISQRDRLQMGILSDAKMRHYLKMNVVNYPTLHGAPGASCAVKSGRRDG